MPQTTLRREIHFTGTGLHTGKTVCTVLRPAAADTGIVFHVTNGEQREDIFLSPMAVCSTGLATTLSKNGVRVSTVEHLLGTLRGLGVDNVHVDVNGVEIPIMDGSAQEFADGITRAGIIGLKAPRRFFRLTDTVEFTMGGKSIKAEPYCGFAVDYRIDFPHPVISRQQRFVSITPTTFAQVASSRTFGFLKDVQALQAHGLALGGSLDNAIVLDEKGVLNESGLRSPDEFVRHKILDFVGDLGVFSHPIQGRFTVSCSGHEVNNAFARHLMGHGLLRLETEGQTTRAFKPKNMFLPESPRQPAEAMLG